MPSYLAADDPVMLPTSNKVKGIKAAIMAANPNTHLLICDYLDLFLSSLINYKIDYHALNDNNFIEVVEKNGVDRQVPGYKLSARFMEFFGGRVMATMAIGKPAVMLTEESEDVVPELCPNSDEASTKIIKYIQ